MEDLELNWPPFVVRQSFQWWDGLRLLELLALSLHTLFLLHKPSLGGHPGTPCAVGVVPRKSGQQATEVACGWREQGGVAASSTGIPRLQPDTVCCCLGAGLTGPGMEVWAL